MAICQNCGAQIQDGVQFCPNCGSMQTFSTPQQPPFQPNPGYYTQPQTNPTNGKTIAALVLGIVSICISCFYGIFGLIAGVIGLILAILSRKQAKGLHQREGSGLRTAALVCSIVGVAISVLFVILYVVTIAIAISDASTYSDTYQYHDFENFWDDYLDAARFYLGGIV